MAFYTAIVLYRRTPCLCRTWVDAEKARIEFGLFAFLDGMRVQMLGGTLSACSPASLMAHFGNGDNPSRCRPAAFCARRIQVIVPPFVASLARQASASGTKRGSLIFQLPVICETQS